MYKRLSAVMFPVLVVTLIGFGVWGYQEHQDKNAILIKAENQYQRAFHDLSHHVDKLHIERGKTLAVNTTSQAFQRKGLINVWSLSNQAQSDISQLPLTLLPFHNTEEFLANTSNFTYRAAVRDLNKTPLDKEEFETLTTLYERSKQISSELRDVQEKVIANNLRWMDVELALATENMNLDNQIIDGFKTADKNIKEDSDVDWGTANMAALHAKDFQKLSGEPVTTDFILEKVTKITGNNNVKEMNIVENGAETTHHSISVTLENEINLDFSKKGGHLIWFMNPREVNGQKQTVAQAQDAAQAFLNEQGYPNMEPIGFDQYGDVGSITFAKKINDVIIYPENLSIRVAMDNGDIIGFQANNFLFKHKPDRKIPAPKLTEEEAKQDLNPNFKIVNQVLAIMENDIDEEVFCYQFSGSINGEDYRIFINAESGIEEGIEVVNKMNAENRNSDESIS